MTEDIFTGILEAYRKDEINIGKTKRQIRLLLDPKSTSDVVNKNDLLHNVSPSVSPEGRELLIDFSNHYNKNAYMAKLHMSNEDIDNYLKSINGG